MGIPACLECPDHVLAKAVSYIIQQYLQEPSGCMLLLRTVGLKYHLCVDITCAYLREIYAHPSLGDAALMVEMS